MMVPTGQLLGELEQALERAAFEDTPILLGELERLRARLWFPDDDAGVNSAKRPTSRPRKRCGSRRTRRPRFCRSTVNGCIDARAISRSVED